MNTKARREFIERVERLERRFAGAAHKYVDAFLMPRELLLKIRDELKSAGRSKQQTKSNQRGLFE